MTENNSKKKNDYFTKIWIPILVITTLFGILFFYHFVKNIQPYAQEIQNNKERLLGHEGRIKQNEKDIQTRVKVDEEHKALCKELTQAIVDLKIVVTELKTEIKTRRPKPF